MLQQKKYPLTRASIDAASDDAERFLKQLGIGSEAVTANRLCIEEVLLGWLNANAGESFSLHIGTRFRKPCIIAECIGKPCNVFEQHDEANAVLMKNLLNSIGRYPAYSYRNGKNVVEFTIPREKKNGLVRILIAIAAAIAVGLLFKFLCSAVFVNTVLSNVLNPLYAAAFRVLGFISGPLIFLSVMWGIYGIGDASTLNLVGKKMIVKFLLIIFAIAAVATATFPFFKFSFADTAGASSSFGAIFEMILDIIPPNIAEPFTSGNTLHLIFCAVIFGIAMLFLGKRVGTVADLVEQINCIVQFLMTFISKMMPGFVFLVVLRITLNGTLSIFSSVWKLFLLFIAAVVVICTAFTLTVACRHKVSPLLLIKKSVPTFLIAVTTASSAAAFSSNMDTCENKFGIDNSLCAFGIPLGMVMFKTSTTAYYVLVSLFFANRFGLCISPDWLISVAFISAMLAVATPPIPGGGVAAYTMLFAASGIPDEALAIVLSMDILFDFVRTAANMYNLPLALIGVSSKMGKLNTDVLHRK